MRLVLLAGLLVIAGCGTMAAGDASPSPPSRADAIRESLLSEAAADLSDATEEEIDRLGTVTCDLAESLHQERNILQGMDEDSFAAYASKLMAVAPSRQHGLTETEAIKFNDLIIEACCPEMSFG